MGKVRRFTLFHARPLVLTQFQRSDLHREWVLNGRPASGLVPFVAPPKMDIKEEIASVASEVYIASDVDSASDVMSLPRLTPLPTLTTLPTLTPLPRPTPLPRLTSLPSLTSPTNRPSRRIRRRESSPTRSRQRRRRLTPAPSARRES